MGANSGKYKPQKKQREEQEKDKRQPSEPNRREGWQVKAPAHLAKWLEWCQIKPTTQQGQEQEKDKRQRSEQSESTRGANSGNQGRNNSVWPSKFCGETSKFNIFGGRGCAHVWAWGSIPFVWSLKTGLPNLLFWVFET